MDQSDRCLVESVLLGDAAAFGLLYDRYARVVRAVCFEMTSDPDAKPSGPPAGVMAISLGSGR